MNGHWKCIPPERIKLPEAVRKQNERDLFHNQALMTSIDQIYLMSGSKAAEQILLKLIEDCQYKETKPAKTIWSPTKGYNVKTP